MLKGSEVVGKPVVSFDSGSVIERVKDVVFDAVNNYVIAFLVREGGVFSDARVIPFSKIKASGPDAVTVESEKTVISAQTDANVQRALDSKSAVKGAGVFTEDGKNLGTISDLYFNEFTGAVEGYEISGGLLGDAMRGKSFLPAEYTLKLGKRVALVSRNSLHLLERQVGGLEGVTKKAGDRMAEVRDQAMPRIQDAVGSAKNVVSSSWDKAKNAASEGADQAMAAAESAMGTVKEKTQQFSDEQLVGRAAGRTVRTNAGNIIVAEGQFTTPEIAEQARAEGKMAELAAAVGLLKAQEVRSKTSSAVSAASGNVAQGAQAAGEGLRDAYLGIREKFLSYRNRAARKLEERRIQNAIGKPVTKVIYDKQDNMILNTGDLITHQAVDLARQAGMLDSLLNAVSTDKPSFTKEELKAQPS